MKKLLLLLLFVLLTPLIAAAQVSHIATTCAGVTSCTFAGATINSNDILIGCTFRDGNNTAPTVPVGWTPIENSVGTLLNGASLAWKAAAGGGADVSGTWAGATSLNIEVYRGVNTVTPIGGHASNEGSNTTVNYPALTMTNSSGTSWVVMCAGTRAIVADIEGPPGATTMRQDNLDGTDELVSFDTNAGVTAWASTNKTITPTSTWRTQIAELLAATTTTTTTTTTSTTTTTLPHLLSSTGVGQ